MFRNNVKNQYSDSVSIWKVTHPDTNKISYLFGLHHTLKNKYRAQILDSLFSSKIFRKIDLVMTETGDAEKQFNDDSNSFYNDLSKSIYKDIPKTKLVNNFRKTMDYDILRFAKENNLPILRLENLSQGLENKQIADARVLMDMLKKPKNWLKGTLITLTFPVGIPIYVARRSIKKSVRQKKLIKHYVNGDIKYNFGKPAEKEFIIDNRNLLWFNHGAVPDEKNTNLYLDKNVLDLLNMKEEDIKDGVFSIKKLFKQLNIFLAPGFAHLDSTECGLFSLLKNDGFIVERFSLNDLLENKQEELNTYSLS